MGESPSRRVKKSASKALFLFYNIRLPGQYFDEETSMFYNGPRYYDPGRGGYDQPDPIGQRGGLGLYVYGLNNPLSRIDPLGLASVTLTLIDGIGGAITIGRDNQTGQWFWGGRLGAGVEDGLSFDPLGKRPGRDETPCHGTTLGTYVEVGATAGLWTWNPIQAAAGVDEETGDDYHEGPVPADTATMNQSPRYGFDIGGSIGFEAVHH